MCHDVFISYSSKNKNAANAICHALENSGVKCWIAPRDIPAGSEYGDLIDRAIKAAKVLVVVFSQNAAESPWVKGELNIAFEEQKVIIPFRIDATPFSGQNRVILNQKHWIDAFPDYETKFSDLVHAVQTALGHDSESVAISPKTSKSNFKQPIVLKWLFVVSAILIITFGILTYLFKSDESFHYDHNGLKTQGIENLSEEQKTVLTEILNNMILVPAGSFTMGNNYDRSECLTKLDSLSKNPHEVTMDAFYISKYEMTQKQWRTFRSIAGCYVEPGDEKAVDNVSWEEANEMAICLSKLTGLKFSLPSEAQWEYAAGDAKDANRSMFSGFNDGIHHYAWTKSDELNAAAEVGRKSPNQLGLHDMTGNVGEWCLDDYAPYDVEQTHNPVTTSESMRKVYRGGDYRTPNMMDMKITSRYYAPPFVKREATGLRLVINN